MRRGVDSLYVAVRIAVGGFKSLLVNSDLPDAGRVLSNMTQDFTRLIGVLAREAPSGW
jgi:hypothetical protein